MGQAFDSREQEQEPYRPFPLKQRMNHPTWVSSHEAGPRGGSTAGLGWAAPALPVALNSGERRTSRDNMEGHREYGRENEA